MIGNRGESVRQRMAAEGVDDLACLALCEADGRPAAGRDLDETRL